MANLLDFYFEQLVTEGDLDALQANLEHADRRLMADQAYIGVVKGFAVAEHDPVPDLTVDVAGPGVAYDQQGRRVAMPSLTTLDVSVDSNAASTAVVGVGNEKWVSVFVRFTRDESDLRFDGNGVPVFFRRDESFEFIVEQGAEAGAGTATRPALRTDALLIADILLEHGDTQIFDAAIETADVAAKPDSRFQWIFNLTASAPATVRVGPIPDAMQAVLSELNSHIADVGNAHPATAVDYDGSTGPALWPDFVAADNVGDALDAIAQLGSTGGSGLIGFDNTTPSLPDTPATVQAAFNALMAGGAGTADFARTGGYTFTSISAASVSATSFSGPEAEISHVMAETRVTTPEVRDEGGGLFLNSNEITYPNGVVFFGNSQWDNDEVAFNDIVIGGPSGSRVRRGIGSPEGVVTANPGALFLRSDGGNDTTLYVKATGTSNTGWRAVTTAAA